MDPITFCKLCLMRHKNNSSPPPPHPPLDYNNKIKNKIINNKKK